MTDLRTSSSFSPHKGGTARHRGSFSALVISNRRIGEHFYKLRLEFTGLGAEAFKRFRPGQFAQLTFPLPRYQSLKIYPKTYLMYPVGKYYSADPLASQRQKCIKIKLSLSFYTVLSGRQLCE
jgi:hypothetical protein